MDRYAQICSRLESACADEIAQMISFGLVTLSEVATSSEQQTQPINPPDKQSNY